MFAHFCGFLSENHQPWGRKSAQRIRQHHQIWEEKHCFYTLSADFDPWKRRLILEICGFFQVAYFVGFLRRSTPRRLKSASFTRLSSASAPQIGRWHGNLKTAVNAGRGEGPQTTTKKSGVFKFHVPKWVSSTMKYAITLRLEAVFFLYLFKKNIWDNKQ